MRANLAYPVALLALAAARALPAQAAGSPQAPSPAPATVERRPPLEKVTGIGGFFFRSADPKALAAWYETHLGVTKTPESYDQEPWSQEAGITVFAPFPAATTYFGDSAKQWMINFRVRNLDAMVAQLTRDGIAVEVDPQVYPNGRFAKLTDPEGNGIQLWEAKRPNGR